MNENSQDQEAIEALGQPGKLWMSIGVETTIAWPEANYEFFYHGYRILLRASTFDRLPAICIQYEEEVNWKVMRKFSRELMSVLAWVESNAIHAVDMGISRFPSAHYNHQSVRYTAPLFSLRYFPEITNLEAKLALAYYREALCVNSFPYKFLSHWKIIAMLNNDGSAQQTSWLINALSKLQESDGEERLKTLAAQGKTLADVRDHLYWARRCAIAHATNEPRVNPDDPEDESEIIDDLPLVKALSEYAIENDFGVLSRDTYYRREFPELFADAD